MSVKLAVACPGKRGEIDELMRIAKLLMASQLEWENDALRMKGLDRFHETGGLSCRQRLAFTLKRCYRTRVWAADKCHRYADSVQACDVGDPCNSHDRHERANTCERLLRFDNPMGTPPESFATGVAPRTGPATFH